MNTRKTSVIIGLLIFIATLILPWFIVNGDDDEPGQPREDQAAPVLMMEYKPEPIQSSIRFTGRVIPFNQYEIYAEVSGIFEQGDHPFKTGTSFNRGDILIQINDDEERQQLESARYEFLAIITRILPDISIDYPDQYDQWQRYLDDMDPTTSLQPLPEVTDRQFRMYLNRQNVYSRYSSIRQQEVRLAKFMLRAPYDGVVTDHRINPGALVQNGQILGQFTGSDKLEIEASVPAREALFISVGDQVTIETDGISPESYRAAVNRKNAVIDSGTQTVKVYMEARGSELTPGDYLEGFIGGQVFPDAFKIHKDILTRDNELFIVEDNRAKLQTIQLLASAGDSMIISGLQPGTNIIDEFRDAAFEDARVTEREDL